MANKVDAATAANRNAHRTNRKHLRPARSSPLKRYARSVARDMYALRFLLALVILWLLFAAGVYLAEQQEPQPVINSYGEALYWGVAAFSTAGIANQPASSLALIIGGLWIVTGSMIFFGIIVATVTGYFMRPLQRPVHRLVETIEYNLEHLEDLSIEEMDLLRSTIDSLISHMEWLKEKES